MQGLEEVSREDKLKVELAVEARVNEGFRTLSALKALACFYPKFSYDDDVDENSAASSSAQTKMYQALLTGEYQVRISPKHSGSLALWTIGEDFFQAKNSTSNLFTEATQAILVGVIASFCPGETPAERVDAAKLKIALMKEQCAGLCVGMEVVGRGMTGEHGDTPNVNYAVVTSVYGSGRFLTATEVTEFCVRWGLLWNESFLITSPTKFLRFCELHERELVHGNDSSFMPQLKDLADTYIPGVQHGLLQGKRLEGVVVRLERRDTTVVDVEGALELFSSPALEFFSQDIDCKWNQANHDGDVFRSLLAPENEEFWGPSRVVKMTQAESDVAFHELMSANPTGQIADLLRFLQGEPKYTKSIKFHGYRLNGKIFFILHVLHDEVFAHYDKHKPEGLMPLFRGFSFWNQEGQVVAVSSEPEASEPEISCMFKAKFMPYMIRTFIMRNGGGRLCDGKSGLQEYEGAVDRYLKAWCTTPQQLTDAVQTYRAYLVDWGKFLCLRKASGDSDPLKKGYLCLIPVFEEWIKTKSVSQGSVKKGAVIVITYSCVPQEGSEALHTRIAQGFENSVYICAWAKDIHKAIAGGEIKNYVAAGTTVIILASITGDGVIKGLEEALAPVLNVSWWIHEGHGANLSQINPGKGKGLVPKWLAVLTKIPKKFVPPTLKTPLQQIANFEVLNSPPVDPRLVIEAIVATPELERTKTTVIIMPLIPGCGKTTLTCPTTIQELSERTGAKVLFFDGDDPSLKEKYWAKLRDHISGLPLFGGDFIIICSKNAPPTSYDGSQLFYQRDLRQLIPADQVLAVLPDDMGTTTHPFSLEFLLLCASRVVNRTSETHATLHGLDAWKVVIKFYNFYADMQREELERSLSVLAKSLIQLPLVSKEAAPMPEDLVSLLVRGIQNAEAVTTVEMLTAFQTYKEYIDTLNVPREVCAVRFISQITEFVEAFSGQPTEPRLPQYVGVFFDETGQAALRSMGCTVQQPHITIWHNSHGEPIETVRPHIGSQVIVSGDALLRSPTHVALRVRLIRTTNGIELPCQNDFAHITLVCPKGEAHKSNDLPLLLEQGVATLELLPMPLVLMGEVKEKK